MSKAQAAACADHPSLATAVLRTGDAIDRVAQPARALRGLADLLHPTHAGTLDFSLTSREDFAWLMDIVTAELLRKLETAQEAADAALNISREAGP